MAIEGNCGDELSLYLAARMCCKHIAVITKSSIWCTGKLDNREDFISLSDVDLILIYLGKGVFRGTKPKPVLFHHTPQPELDSPSRKDEDYIPPTTSKVYKLESTLPQSSGTPNLWDHLPSLLILNQHLIGTVCTLSPNQPLKNQTLVGPGSQRLNKLLSRRKFIKFIEDPGIHQNHVPYVGKNSAHRRI